MSVALPNRVVSSALAIIAASLALAILIGAIEVPNVADAVAEATSPLGAWVYLAVAAFVFLETTVLLGFLIHGELLLMLGGAAAARGDATLAAMIALTWAAAVAGDMVSLLLGRRLGRPFLERHGARVRLGAAQLARVDGFFARHGPKALFLGRFTGFLRSTMPFVVGSSGVRLRRLVPFSAASGLVWTGDVHGDRLHGRGVVRRHRGRRHARRHGADPAGDRGARAAVTLPAPSERGAGGRRLLAPPFIRR